MYSAIKVNGKKLYEYARMGKEVKVKPRTINIYNIYLEEFDRKNNEIIFIVECSKGTYIRTLCEDIAKKLNTIGCMKELERLQVGRFNIENSIKIGELKEYKDNQEFIQEHFIEFEEVLKDKPSYILTDKETIQFLNGIKLKKNIQDGICRVYSIDNEFIGTAEVEDGFLKRDIVIL